MLLLPLAPASLHLLHAGAQLLVAVLPAVPCLPLQQGLSVSLTSEGVGLTGLLGTWCAAHQAAWHNTCMEGQQMNSELLVVLRTACQTASDLPGGLLQQLQHLGSFTCRESLEELHAKCP